MSPDRIRSFRLDDTLYAGLQILEDRDGVLKSESIRRAIRAWLAAKGVPMPAEKGASRRVKARRKA